VTNPERKAALRARIHDLTLENSSLRRTLRRISAESNWAPLPADAEPIFNGGVACDMLIGPCACGAWHTAAEKRSTAK